MHWNRTLAAAFLAAGISSSLPAAAETWDMPTPYPEGNFHTVNIVAFAEEVKQATGGAVEIVVHPNGSLVKHPEIKNAVRSGQVQIGEFLLSLIANENPAFGVDSVPFLATGYDDAWKLWQASREQVAALLAEQDLVLLYAVAWPPQGIYASKEITRIEDLAGLKFRSYNAATERLAQLAGAVPTQIEAADVAQAFATGRVEAMITSSSTGVNSKVWDFLDRYYDTEAWLPKNVVVINRAVFEGLDQAQRDAILAAAAAAEARGWEASKAENAKQKQTLADNGVVVAPPSEALAAGLKAIGATMSEEWKAGAGEVGQAILDGYAKP